MPHSSIKLDPRGKESAQETCKTTLIEEFPALPEKFFTFTHEMIALLWMKETTQSPVRGTRHSKKQ